MIYSRPTSESVAGTPPDSEIPIHNERPYRSFSGRSSFENHRSRFHFSIPWRAIPCRAIPCRGRIPDLSGPDGRTACTAAGGRVGRSRFGLTIQSASVGWPILRMAKGGGLSVHPHPFLPQIASPWEASRGGPERMGHPAIYGDFVLRNDHVVVVVANPIEGRTARPPRGGRRLASRKGARGPDRPARPAPGDAASDFQVVIQLALPGRVGRNRFGLIIQSASLGWPILRIAKGGGFGVHPHPFLRKGWGTRLPGVGTMVGVILPSLRTLPFLRTFGRRTVP